MSWDNPAQAGFSLEDIGLTGYRTAGRKRDNVRSGGAAAHIIFLFPAVQDPVRPARNACVLSGQVSPPYCPKSCPNLSLS